MRFKLNNEYRFYFVNIKTQNGIYYSNGLFFDIKKLIMETL